MLDTHNIPAKAVVLRAINVAHFFVLEFLQYLYDL